MAGIGEAQRDACGIRPTGHDRGGGAGGGDPAGPADDLRDQRFRETIVWRLIEDSQMTNRRQRIIDMHDQGAGIVIRRGDPRRCGIEHGASDSDREG